MARKYTDKAIIDALQKTDGNISAAARAIGCGRSTVQRRIKSVEKVEKAYNSINEATLDKAENQLIELVLNGDHKDHFKALKFYLTTKGKSRGFVTKSIRENINENRHEFLNDLFPEVKDGQS